MAAYSVLLRRCHCYIPRIPCPYHHPSGHLLEVHIPFPLVTRRSSPWAVHQGSSETPSLEEEVVGEIDRLRFLGHWEGTACPELAILGRTSFGRSYYCIFVDCASILIVNHRYASIWIGVNSYISCVTSSEMFNFIRGICVFIHIRLMRYDRYVFQVSNKQPSVSLSPPPPPITAQ